MTPDPPKRLPDWEERLASRLFTALTPRLPAARQPEPFAGLAPFVKIAIEREHGDGPLSAVWFPAAEGKARGAVLLLHPWTSGGKSYFYRRGRIPALRAAGYHALTFDFPGAGDSGTRYGFLHRDVEAALRFLRRRVGDLPIHVWGVSAGGYWAHPVLSATDDVCGAMFEDVALHLTDWGWRMEPALRPGYLLFRHLFARAYRFLDIRRHAAALGVEAATYVSGERDPNVLPEETRQLAALAGAGCRIIPGADHLAAIKVANAEVIELALDTFRRAEAMRSGEGVEGAATARLGPRRGRPAAGSLLRFW
jgi:pimeloyl-ACP methyl ester carboxylesterase